MVPRDGGFLTRMPVPDVLPAWLSKADLDFYAGEFTRTGFRGGLNWYRNIDRSWELLAPFAQAKVTVPALYMAGDRDLVVAFPQHGQGDCQLGDLRAATARFGHSSGLRPLDPTGTCSRGQRRDDRFPA